MTLQAGFDPLLRSIGEGDLETLERLFCTGQYSVNEEVCYYSEDDKNYIITPLYWAVKLNQREICGYLLQNGAHPYKHMVYEYYPLHEACNKGNCGIVQEFIEANCNLNKRNCDGDTPLHIACLRGHTKCICLLLDAGANRYDKNNKGQTPLQVAQFDQQTELYRLFEKELTSTRLEGTARSKQVSSYPGRRRSFSSAHYHKLARPLSYHSSTSQDDASVSRSKSLRTDVTRTLSFSGSNHYPYYNENRTRNETAVPHVRKDLSARKDLLAKKVSQRPSLSYMSHDSQLVLPTQRLIPDPRRTQTCHEFQGLPPKVDHRLKTPSPEPPLAPSPEPPLAPSPDPPLTPDDIEADAIHPRQPNVKGGRIRVNHMVQCLHPALKARDTTEAFDIHNECLLKVLYSIHGEIGYSDDEYSAINQLVSEREDVYCNRPSASSQADKDLEYVWGCDYELMERHPLRVKKDSPIIDHAEMTFHVRLSNSHTSRRDRESLLKVIVHLSHFEEAGQFDVYGNHGDLCREGSIMSSISPHPNIAKCVHHCLANSRPFERFTRQFCQDDNHKSKLAPQCSLLFVEYFSNSLEDVMNVEQYPHSCLHVNSRFGISERSLLLYLAQLLLAVTHLDRHNIILGHISASRVFVQQDHLYFADFAFAYDHTERDDKFSLKSWLGTVPEEVLLAFPPELCEINDLPISSSDSNFNPSTLQKCNVYSVGNLFQRLLRGYNSSRDFGELTKLSEHFQYLLENLVNDFDKRLCGIDAILFCLVLIYGPTHDKCPTLQACQEWLISETFHLFLLPSLKGHPMSYKTDAQTKLLFTYLCIATPERLLSIVKMIREVTTRR